MSEAKKHARDNRANQLNPNNFAYYQSRGTRNNEAPRIGGSGEPIQNEAQPSRPQIKNSTSGKSVRTRAGNLTSNKQQRLCKKRQL